MSYCEKNYDFYFAKPLILGLDKTEPYEIIKDLDLSNKNIIVLGVILGGLETTKALAKANATVIVHQRDSHAKSILEGIVLKMIFEMDLTDQTR